MSREDVLFSMCKLRPEDILEKPSSKRVISLLKRKGFQNIDRLAASIKKEKRKRIGNNFVKLTPEKTLEIVFSHLPESYKPIVVEKKEVVVGDRVANEWLRIKKIASAKWETSSFAKKYKSPSDFATNATDAEVIIMENA